MQISHRVFVFWSLYYHIVNIDFKDLANLFFENLAHHPLVRCSGILKPNGIIV
jgi:hypothetical protein